MPILKYVTLFLSNFGPPRPCHTLSHIAGPPLQKYVTHLGPPIFSRSSANNPDKSSLYKFSLNCSRDLLSGALVRGSFAWKVLSRVVLSIPPSLRIHVHLLQQKVKNHFKFHVSYVR